jgi:hypothetical protein
MTSGTATDMCEIKDVHGGDSPDYILWGLNRRVDWPAIADVSEKRTGSIFRPGFCQEKHTAI